MLPEWLDFAGAENVAAAMFRGLRTNPAPWGELIASAQATMGLFQDDLSSDVERLYEEQAALPLIAAARILDAASQAPAGLPAEHRRDLGLVAAVAFGMYGNFLSAVAVMRRSVLGFEDLTSSLAVLVATAAPSLVGEMIPCCPGDSLERRYLEALAAYLRTGDAAQADGLRAGLIECLLAAPSAFEGALLRSCRLCLEHILRLSVARVFREHLPSLPAGLLRKLIDSGVYVLLPPQLKAIVRRRLASRPENAILALPTSTGKTLLGELCLASALGQRPGVVCYLAPYVALAHQVADRLRGHLPQSYHVKLMVGGYRASEPLDPQSRMEVVVATPERLDGLLRTNPDIVHHLRCVVADEAHLIQNDTRGVLLEGVITRLLLLREQGRNIRLILLSAVLAHYDRLKQWIGVPDDLVFSDSWTPTARRLAFWRQSGRLVWCVGTDPIRRPGASNGSLIGEMDLPWPESRFYAASNVGYARKQAPLVYRNVAFLADLFRQRYTDPILCFCPTKESTRMAALALAQRFPPLEAIPSKVGETIALIETSHRFLLPLCDYLRRGVAYHNATLPHDVRRLIEEALRERQLRTVSSTTTLAEGVDFPLRFTILVDWLTWQGDQQRPISTLLFRNIAGRSGRAGLLTEGDTVVFDNPLGDPAFAYSPNRAQIQDDIFLAAQPDEVTSAFDQVSPSTDQQAALHGILASQFLAAIPENPGVNDLAARFGKTMFWARRDENATRVRNALTAIERSILDDAGGALATAASPLRLTPFGETAMRTGFSPESCRLIVQTLREMAAPESQSALGSTLLGRLGVLPEQTHVKLRKELSSTKRSMCRVKRDDLGRLVGSWLWGDPYERMFADLPSVRRSTIRPAVMAWVEGVPEPSGWDAEFDRFVEIVQAAIERFLSWLARACGAFSTLVGAWTLDIDWNVAAAMFESGVDTVWALEADRMGAPAGRVALAPVGRKWPVSFVTNEDPLGLAALRDTATRGQIEEVFREAIDGARRTHTPPPQELVRLRAWLWQRAGLKSPTFE